VSFALDLAGNRVISAPRVGVINDAVAIQMRVSTDPGFRDASWVAYADTTSVAIAAESGFHIVYAQYRNHWSQSAIQTDWAIFSQETAGVEFQIPHDGDVLAGGTPVELRGYAWDDSAGAFIDSVKVNVGDGYVDVTGTLEWSYVWDVPLLMADTPTLIAARAYTHRGAVVDSSTAVISVTISQLHVTITAPVDGTQIISESDVAVTGRAVPFLGGAPLDSVVVLVGSERLRATGLASWEATWTAPLVGGATPIQLVARAFAGPDSVQTVVDLTVVPAR
jgi:hypothetical protein